MTTNKKLGNYTGQKALPTAASAPGAWVSPSEVYTQKINGVWPITPEGAWINVGDLVYAASSGVVTAISGNSYAIADGSTVSRTFYSNLYGVMGTRFGSGDGASNFNTPPLTPIYGYTKCTTISGFQSPSGVGVLPTHTHTLNAGTATGSPQASEGNGGRTSAGNFTFTSSLDGTDNNGKYVEIIPLVSNISGPVPAGCVVACLTPDSVGAVATIIPQNCVIASGQELSRTTYTTLYTRLGNLYGSGNGSTTFNIPDYRGVFLRAPLGRTTIQPSGYTTTTYGADNFIRHSHSVLGAVLNGGDRRCDYTSTTTNTGPPASGPSSIGGGSESRPANITVTFFLVIEDLS